MVEPREKQIEAIAAIISPTCFGADAEALLDRWAGKPHDREAADRAEIKHGLGIGVKRKAAREKARSIIAALTSTPAPSQDGAGLVERIFDADANMADGEVRMTAAEDVLAWLLIEKLGVPDDRNYTPNEAQLLLATRIDAARAREDREALSSGWRSGHVTIAHDGFAGDIIGQYTTREGKRGVVVQQDGTRVVHVYGEKWLEPTPQGEQG